MFMESDGRIITETKISSVSGNFTGTLTDGTKFGSALANPGDLDLDGTIDIVTGAKLDDDGGADRGALWTLFMQQSKTDRKITIFDDKE
jgi:shikimate 5-dehydrogenase